MLDAVIKIGEVIRCEKCGAEITRKSAQQRFCSDVCRYSAKKGDYAADADRRAKARERFHQWYVRNRDSVAKRVGDRRKTVRAACAVLDLDAGSLKRATKADSNPFLLAAPSPSGFIPGGAFALSSTPALRWPVELRNVRGLHGVLTDLLSRLGNVHHQNIPEFAIIPWPTGIGWAVYVRNDADAATLAGKSHAVRFFDQNVSLECGPLARLKWPRECPRQRNLVQLDAVTPVMIRRSGKDDGANGQRPTSGAFHSTLAEWMPRRVGVVVEPERVRISVLKSDQVELVRVPMLGKYGVASGWVGRWVIECNAPGLWLLRLATQIGLGGKVAFGFGRVRLTEIHQ